MTNYTLGGDYVLTIDGEVVGKPFYSAEPPSFVPVELTKGYNLEVPFMVFAPDVYKMFKRFSPMTPRMSKGWRRHVRREKSVNKLKGS